MTATKKENQKAAPESETGASSLAEAATSVNGLSGLVGSASQIVLKAVGILEEEIARGIVTAKQVEEKLTDVPKIRSGKITDNVQFNDLFVRFRKDAHEILDIIVDVVSATVQGAGKISSQLIKIGTETKNEPVPVPAQQVPLIQVPGDMKAGEQKEFPITLENDDNTTEKIITFINTPLISPSGEQLYAGTLVFNPNPLTIPPGSKATAIVKIDIPANAKTGSYTCFIQAKDLESLKATLLLKVI
ncbi:MAG TPA: hypothetical protein DCO83_02805 [Mucilaginibacter sp.]|jgi:hypothetical protein|nr:hypothetical protein [Mucilaginibacter sp.]